MESKNRRRLIGLVSLGLLAGYGVRSTFGANRYKKWVFDAGEAITYAPAVCKDGTVVTGSYRPLFALDGTTGRQKWTFTFPHENEYQLCPAVVGSDDTVYIASQVAGKPYRFYALDGATGRPKWATDKYVAFPHPGDQHVLFLGGKQVTAVEGTTGKNLWTFKPPARADVDPNWPNQGGDTEAIAAGHHMVYAAFGCPYKRLYALDANTGRPRWSVSLKRGEQFACSIPVSIVVTEDGTPILSQIGASLWAYEARTGRALWQLQSKEKQAFESALLQIGLGGLLYVGNDEGAVYAVNARTGIMKWEQKLDAKVVFPPVLSQDGVLYVGTDRNSVYALDARTGQIQWSLSFGWLTLNLLFGYGEDVAITVGPNGMVYATSTTGRLYALHCP